jgi:hypothetical protein
VLARWRTDGKRTIRSGPERATIGIEAKRGGNLSERASRKEDNKERGKPKTNHCEVQLQKLTSSQVEL